MFQRFIIKFFVVSLIFLGTGNVQFNDGIDRDYVQFMINPTEE